MTRTPLTAKQVFERKYTPYAYYCLRPLGRLCLPWVARWRLAPNQVTLASMLVTLIGLGLLVAGGVAMTIAGAVAIVLGHLLDVIDGDLARLTGKASPRGEFLDALGGYARDALLLPAVGVGLTRLPDLGHDAILCVVNLPTETYAQMGLGAGLLYVTSRLISLRYRVLFGASPRGEGGILGRASSNFEDAVEPMLLIGAATQYVSFVLTLYTLHHFAGWLYVVFETYRRAGSHLADE